MAAAQPLLVRDAREADAKDVVALLDTAGLESAFEPREFVIAEESGRVVGCARLRTFPSGAHELASVAVAHDHRRSGIGSRVVEAALARATGAVYALALAPDFFAKKGFTPMLVMAPELEEKARTLCASSGSVPMRWTPNADAHVAEVQRRYAHAAQSGSCCEGGDRRAGAQDYSADELAAIPQGANLGLGTGNPLREASVKEGETVLDLGSGAGVDVLLAAHAVGARGRAIGVDFTREMVAKARENAAKAGVANASFHHAPIEAIPLPDASVDVVISNCVINLSLDKRAALREAHRVMRPGGRFVVSDTLRLPWTPQASVPSCDCTSGALSASEWRKLLEEAGFHDVEVRAGPVRGSVGTATVVARKA